MEKKKLAPQLLKVRAERVLRKPIKTAYRTENPNILECELLNGSKVRVDLGAGIELTALLPINAEDANNTFSDADGGKIKDDQSAKTKPTRKKATKTTAAKKVTMKKKQTKSAK